jgi:SAM-dependent methyltransferase
VVEVKRAARDGGLAGEPEVAAGGDGRSTSPAGPGPNAAVQRASAGVLTSAILEAVLQAAAPEPGCSWLDIGCGTGELLHLIRDRHTPRGLVGIDVVDFLDPDLAADVDHRVGPAESLLADAGGADRVLLAETIEHLEAPWTILRMAARLVVPGGRLVLSTPNVAALRSRLDLLVRGQLCYFRPDNLPHLTPVLPHVARRILEEEGLHVDEVRHAGVDIVPAAGGRVWPRALAGRRPDLFCMSVVMAAARR